MEHKACQDAEPFGSDLVRNRNLRLAVAPARSIGTLHANRKGMVELKKGMNRPVIVFSSVLALVLLATLGGCGKRDAAPQPSESVVNTETVPPSAPAESPAPSEMPDDEVVPGRQDGDRFEAVIILEGMEETVKYEHVRNDRIGFEMDYDYELFERHSESDREWFGSCYDDPANSENYLEVTRSEKDADTAAASIGEMLSAEYDIIRESFALDHAEGCIRIDASEAKGGMGTPDLLQMVYIIPAPDGCRIATAHYSFESAEGFGRRFQYFMNTFSVIAAQGAERLSDEQALAAVQKYCFMVNPDLEVNEEDDEYPVYWEVTSSDEQEIVVMFRSYTGAVLRYYIDPISGNAYVTEFVPGISAGEERTEETLNVREYID